MGLSLVGSALEPLLGSAFSTAAPPAGITILKLREQETIGAGVRLSPVDNY